MNVTKELRNWATVCLGDEDLYDDCMYIADEIDEAFHKYFDNANLPLDMYDEPCNLDDVVLYGEEAGQAVYNYTGIIESVLENTGGALSVTTRKVFYRELNTRAYVRSEDIYAGVMPDVEVLQTFEGYRNGVDEVYLKAVSE